MTKKIRVEASKQDSPALLNDTIPVYTIKRGETLWDLATAFYGNRHYSNLLAKYNGIQDVTSIKAGILIKVPDLRTMLKDPKMGLFPIIGKEIENIFGSTLLIHEK